MQRLATLNTCHRGEVPQLHDNLSVTSAILAYWGLRSGLGATPSATGRQLEALRDGVSPSPARCGSVPGRLSAYLEVAPLLDGLTERERYIVGLRYWGRGECDSILRRGDDGVLIELRRSRQLRDADVAQLAGLSLSQVREAVRSARIVIRANIEARCTR